MKDCTRHQDCIGEAREIVEELLGKIPEIRRKVSLDVSAANNGDPAARSDDEVILAYPCIQAIMVHRIAHELWNRDVALIPRMMSEYVHGKTGIDIHPGAVIGGSFFIDHGTGVVIGETTVIGDNVKIYQGVTLGALSVRKQQANKKRHPTIEDDVTIYAGATILGGETVVGRGTIIGGNVWLTESVPPGSRILHQPSQTSRIRREGGEG
jgi:serine O-acetyltransferase